MSDTPRKRDQSKNINSHIILTPEQRAEKIVQELALNGESFNDLRFVKRVLADELRAHANPT